MFRGGVAFGSWFFVAIVFQPLCLGPGRGDMRLKLRFPFCFLCPGLDSGSLPLS